MSNVTFSIYQQTTFGFSQKLLVPFTLTQEENTKFIVYICEKKTRLWFWRNLYDLPCNPQLTTKQQKKLIILLFTKKKVVFLIIHVWICVLLGIKTKFGQPFLFPSRRNGDKNKLIVSRKRGLCDSQIPLFLFEAIYGQQSTRGQRLPFELSYAMLPW